MQRWRCQWGVVVVAVVVCSRPAMLPSLVCCTPAPRTHAALYCAWCTLFTLLFTFRYGREVTNAWAIAFGLAFIFAGFVADPATVALIATFRHITVWLFANRLGFHVNNAAVALAECEQSQSQSSLGQNWQAATGTRAGKNDVTTIASGMMKAVYPDPHTAQPATTRSDSSASPLAAPPSVRAGWAPPPRSYDSNGAMI